MDGTTERNHRTLSRGTLPATVSVILACAHGFFAGACGARSELDEHDSAGRPSVPLDATPPGDGAPGVDGDTSGPCVPIPPQTVASSPSAAAPSLAFDGRTYGLLWADSLPDGCRLTQWHVDRLDAAGNRFGSRVDLPPRPSSRGTLHFHAGELWAITSGELGTLAHRIGPGEVADWLVLVRGGDVGAHDSLITESGALAIAHSVFGLGHPIDLRIFEEVTSPDPWITSIPGSRGDVRLTEADEGLVVAMSAEDIGVSLITPGEAAGEPAMIYEGPPPGFITGPADVARLASGSAVFSVARSGFRAIEMVRIDAGGSVRDVRQVSSVGQTLYPTAATDGTSGEVGLMWRHAEFGEPLDTPYELRFRRFDADGEPLEPEEVIFDNHQWLGCNLTDTMALLATGDGFAFATANVTSDGGSEIIFGKLCR